MLIVQKMVQDVCLLPHILACWPCHDASACRHVCCISLFWTGVDALSPMHRCSVQERDAASCPAAQSCVGRMLYLQITTCLCLQQAF